MVVKLPGPEALGGRPSLRSGRAIASQDTTAIGEGLATFGAGLTKLGASLEKAKEEDDVFDLAKARAEYAKGRIQLEDGFNQDQDWKNYGTKYDKASAALKERAGALIRNPKLREKFGLSVADDEAASRSRVMSRAVGLEKDEARASINEYLRVSEETAANPQTDEATRAKLIGDVNEAIESRRRAGVITDQEAQKLRAEWPRGYKLTLWNRAIQRDPGAALNQLRKADLPSRANEAMEFLQGKGWSRQAASGIVGNLIQESASLNPEQSHDGGTGIGIAGWRLGRRAALERFAAARGQFATDFRTQLEFLDSELRGEQGDAGAAKAGQLLQGAQTPEEAAAAFMHFERPAGYTEANPRSGHGWENRRRNAETVFANERTDLPGTQFLTQQDIATLADKADRENQRNRTERAKRDFETASLVQDDVASIRSTGVGVDNLDPERVRQALGDEKYQAWVESRQDARTLYDASTDMPGMPTAQIQERLDTLKPVPGTADYARKAKVYNDAVEIAQKIEKQRAEDPAAAVAQAPAVKAAAEKAKSSAPADIQSLVSTSLATQAQLGIPAYAQRPITRRTARELALPIISASRVTGRDDISKGEREAVKAVIDKVVQDYGPFADKVLPYVIEETTKDRQMGPHATRILQKLMTGEKLTATEQQNIEISSDAADAARAVSSEPPPEAPVKQAEPAPQTNSSGTLLGIPLPAVGPFGMPGPGAPQKAPAAKEAAPQEPRYPVPPPRAIRALIDDPSKAAEFDKHYGPGTAASILGNEAAARGQ